MDILKKIQEKPPRILVVGDIMLDRFIFGKVERISPEAPVPVVRSIKEEYSLGGCGNVIRNLINLGAKAYIVSLVGNDRAGEKILKDLREKSISTKHLIQSKSIQTTEKMRIVAEGQQLVRVDWDPVGIKGQYLNQILKHVYRKMSVVEGVIISDYNKGVCTELVTKSIIDKAKELQIPVFVDPKGERWNKYYGSSIITPNIKEAEEASGCRLNTTRDIENVGKKICKELSLDGCLITRGPSGMSFIGGKSNFHISSEAKEIYDVSGAGDTVIASFVVAMVAGFDSETATRFANKAAGIVVGHIGTTAIEVSELG